MTSNDLLALLAEAREELNVLASHLGHPEVEWPTMGLKLTAKAHMALRDRIALALTQPVEEVPLREENLALRAALRSLQSNEEWRVRYQRAESERVKAMIRVQRLEWDAEAACENTPTKGCECPGCETARERALRGEA